MSDESLRAAAALAGYDPDVLKGLPGAAAATYDAINGIPYITPAGGKRVRLVEHAAAAWSQFLPALGADGAALRERIQQQRDADPMFYSL